MNCQVGQRHIGICRIDSLESTWHVNPIIRLSLIESVIHSFGVSIQATNRLICLWIIQQRDLEFLICFEYSPTNLLLVVGADFSTDRVGACYRYLGQMCEDRLKAYTRFILIKPSGDIPYLQKN